MVIDFKSFFIIFGIPNVLLSEFTETGYMSNILKAILTFEKFDTRLFSHIVKFLKVHLMVVKK